MRINRNKRGLAAAPEQLSYIDSFRPMLIDGDYTLTVEQSISSADGKINEAEPFKCEKKFTVRGERFSLDPSEISVLFPPADGTGEYSMVLPHIVFSRKSLPWERNLGEPFPEHSWLALLLFTEDDPKVEVKTETLNSLKHPELPEDIFFPSFCLEFGEAWTDLCSYIDVEPNFLSKIVPSSEDSNYLVHGRTTINEEGVADEYAVIVCNRLPAIGKKSTVHLVSFEGYGKYLYPFDELNKYKKVRLVSLKNWSFTSYDPEQTFAGILQKLDTATAGLQLKPVEGSVLEVTNAMNMGYTAMNHITRQGDKTISWYRGPLTPYEVDRKVELPIINSDAISLYNPDTGMFDMSYSAAWQIGRLLALQNKSFSMSLYSWKRENWKKLLSALDKQRMNDALGIDINEQQCSFIVSHLQGFVDKEKS